MKGFPMDNNVFSLPIIVKKIPAKEQYYTIRYDEIAIDEERAAVCIKDNNDKDLGNSIRSKGLNFEDNELLIPIKRSKRKQYLPSYIPLKFLLSKDTGVYYSPIENYYIVLHVTGNFASCIDKYNQQQKKES